VTLPHNTWYEELTELYTRSSARLQQAYAGALVQLEETLERLNSQVETNPDVNIRTLGAYQTLITELTSAGNRFGNFAYGVAIEDADRSIAIGTRSALDLALSNSSQSAAIINEWQSVDQLALIEAMSAIDRGSLRENLETLGTLRATQVDATVLALIAQGKNPTFIARRMSEMLSAPFHWADSVVRTTTLYSWRSATHTNYRANSNIVQGWVWVSSLDMATCLACLTEHGRLYGLNATLNDHHRGRCVPVPYVRGETWLDGYPTGEQWFGSLSPEQQRARLGDNVYEAWNRGEVNFSDFRRTYNSDVYGEMIRQASEMEILE
jgi:hypothetical protein